VNATFGTIGSNFRLQEAPILGFWRLPVQVPRVPVQVPRVPVQVPRVPVQVPRVPIQVPVGTSSKLHPDMVKHPA
jgi:hypothetical protein